MTTYVIRVAYENRYKTAGQFSEAKSGRPRGSRNKAALALQSLLESQAEALRETAVQK